MELKLTIQLDNSSYRQVSESLHEVTTKVERGNTDHHRTARDCNSKTFFTILDGNGNIVGGLHIITVT